MSLYLLQTDATDEEVVAALRIIQEATMSRKLPLRYDPIDELRHALKMCASFIENDLHGPDDPNQQRKFFACREAWRNALANSEEKRP